jgi:hypothetical protein
VAYDHPSNKMLFGTSGVDRVTIDGSGNVGIGTPTPVAKLDVIGNIKISDGTQGTGKVLTSDANGLASWQTPAGADNDWTISGNNMFSAVSGNVGIGTVSPMEKLHVSGGNIAIDFGQAYIMRSSGGTNVAALSFDGANTLRIGEDIARGAIIFRPGSS